MKCNVVGVTDPFSWKNKKTGQEATAVVIYVTCPFSGRTGLGLAVESIFMDSRSSEYSTALTLKPGMRISVSRNRSGFVDEINVLKEPVSEPAASK